MLKVKAINANSRSDSFFMGYVLQETCQNEILIGTNIVFFVVS